MIEINLLSRVGVHLKGDSGFHNIDDTLISEVSVDFKKDFESTHQTKKTKIKRGKKRIFFYCLLKKLYQLKMDQKFLLSLFLKL